MKCPNPLFRKITFLFLIASSLGIMSALAESPEPGQPDPGQSNSGQENGQASGDDLFDHTDTLHQIAYGHFGPRFYKPNLGYPAPDHVSPGYRELGDHVISFNSGAVLDEKADRTGWVPIPLNDRNYYYRAEYAIKDIKGLNIDQVLDKVDATSNKGKFSKSERNEIREKAKFQMVVYPTDAFQLEYFPGHMLLMTSDGGAKGEALNTPRGGNIAWSPHFNRLNLKEQFAAAGIFKAAFDNPDGRHNGRLPGLIVEGQVIDPLQDELAGIAIYKDGTLKMGRYRDLQNKQDIRFLRQNEYPILEHGNLTSDGAFPKGWNRYKDNIMRSYYAMSEDGKYIAFLWTNFCPPALIASTLQTLHFDEMVLADIHPSIGAAAATPYSHEKGASDFFDESKHYFFVPKESSVLDPSESSAIEALRKAPMQWGVNSAKTGSPNDFYAIMIKDELNSEQSNAPLKSKRK